MKFQIRICLFLLFSLITLANASDWPAWRGPLGTGEAPDGKPPVQFSETQNIKWKTPIPGKGLSTAIVYGNQIFITSAVDSDKPVTEEDKKNQENMPMWLRASGTANSAEKMQNFIVYSISLETGDVLWQKTVREQLPHEGTHKDGSWASNSCVTDGTHLFAFFGSYGLYCLTLNGELVWQKDLGDMSTRNQFGAGSSPALYDKYLVINWDHEGDSFITVLNKNNGNEFWRKNRDEKTSWTTPVIVEVDNRMQVIVSGTNASIGYDLATGDIIWQLSGMTGNVIPTPVLQNNVVYLISGFRGNALQAVKLDGATGNLDGTESVLWSRDEKITPYVPSPLLYQGNLYFFFGNKEQLSCVDVKTGTIHYAKQDIEDMKGVYASPVAADGKIYVAGRNGFVAVIQPGPEYKLIAGNTLDDNFDASPAIAGNNLILRGLKNLYCFSK